MEIMRCTWCGHVAVPEENEIKVKQGLRQVVVESTIYRCTVCERTMELKEDKGHTADDLKKGEQRANTENRIHRTKKKNAEKIPENTSGERVFKR